ncbi:MAG: type IV secretion protein IcmB [Pseudomonadota bacterium]|nr:type IV secretion protein IcmB [Pseudomonadota bacterium]
MGAIVDNISEILDTLLAALSSGLKQTVESYCDIHTADSKNTLVATDGSLLSVVKIDGVKALVGQEEYERIHDGALQNLSTSLAEQGHSIQVYFGYSREKVKEVIEDNYAPTVDTLKDLGLNLDDLLQERLTHITNYCGFEEVYVVLWSKITLLTGDQSKRALKEKGEKIAEKGYNVKTCQNVIAAIPDLRNAHDSLVKSFCSSMESLGLVLDCLSSHDAVTAIRRILDPDFTDRNWSPSLPGDKFNPKVSKTFDGDISELLWPSLTHQIIPRDALNIDLQTVKVGGTLYSSVFIDLFPKEIQSFMTLFNRALPTGVPWRISFLMDGGGMRALQLKRAFSSLLSFSSSDNRLINDAVALLDYINVNTDDSVVRLRVAACTWAPEGNIKLLRNRSSQLARAIQGWGSCDVSEICGDAFEGYASSLLAFSANSVATNSVASLSDVLYMMPFYRPASPWKNGALLLRSPDGKPWPYQPGSPRQTTWIDLMYARPGSGKSVLSNAMNLALCMAPGISRLPRISVIDIGPSSSGLISLLKEALPDDKKHQVAYHRLRMTKDYSINPFDTQLGSRYPAPQERTFLINFISLLATPVGSDVPYDGIIDMSGMLVDEAYKQCSEDGNPNSYAQGVEDIIDAILQDIGFVIDSHTTWWEVTDALFSAGFSHEATLAQRNAMPLISDLTSICRLPAVEDLYGNVSTKTGELLINAFARMISSAVREYPILSRVTKFDLGDARVVSMDLDEVAKSGGNAADRQTAVMYMLARYILAKDFYLTLDSLSGISDIYRDFHEKRIQEIREDSKRLVLDEFHRTSKVQSVRDQVVQDMREGRKWNVQIALISQSLDDFDEVMVEFGTSIFIMDAGPEQAINKTVKVFGLSQTARTALKTSVHGPRAGGSTFLAQFATKDGINIQLLTLTLGPIELWAFSTTAEDAFVRNKLYIELGPAEARRVLANIFPNGSCTKYIESKVREMAEADSGIITNDEKESVLDTVVSSIMTEYRKDPNFKSL